MSGAFVLRLDTAAPAIEILSATLTDGVLGIAYAVDERGVLGADAAIDGQAFEMVVEEAQPGWT